MLNFSRLWTVFGLLACVLDFVASPEMMRLHRLFQGRLNQTDKTHHRRTWEGAINLQLDTSWQEFPSLDGKLLGGLHLYSKVFFTLPQHEFHIFGAHYRFHVGLLNSPFPFSLLTPTHLFQKFSICAVGIFCSRH